MKITRYKIHIREAENMPRRPFSAVMISDFHDDGSRNLKNQLLDTISSIAPEAVFCTGDQVTAKGKHCSWQNAAALLGELTVRYPVYCVDGNHETRMQLRTDRYGDAYDQYIRKISSLGVRVLNNQVSFAVFENMRFAIYGLCLDMRYYNRLRRSRLTEEDVRSRLGEAGQGFRILLAHHPDYFKTYTSWGADLTLAGHLHGGMIRLPGLGGLIGATLCPFPSYDHGLFQSGARQMIVSAGLGSHTLGLRINNPPELAVLDFIPGEAGI